MAECKLCNALSGLISKELGVCLKCIRERPEQALPIAGQAHARSRKAFDKNACQTVPRSRPR